MDEADFLCDRIGIIDHGQILVIDSVKKLKNSIGNDIILLSCEDIDKLKNLCKKEYWINKIEEYDMNLVLSVEKGDEKIPIIIDIAQKNKIKIKSISVRKPTLDDVFLHFTGRTIRNQEVSNNLKNLPPRLQGSRR